MNKNAKRIVGLLLALVLVLGLAACGKTGGETGGQSDDGKITLTIGVPLKSNIIDYKENDFTKWLEEYTGYNLEFTFFSGVSGEASTQISTMIAGGEKLPDLIYNVGINTDMRYAYGRDGYLVDLTPYFEDEELIGDYRAHVTEVHGEGYYEEALRGIASPDGKIYGFPNCVVSESDLPLTMMYINQTWLDKLGLEIPRTWDEYVNVLRAFRDGDPNGNGIKDEIPAVGANITRCRIGNWLINNFERVHDQYYFNLNEETGHLWLPYTSDNYRKGVQAIHDLVKEGLVSELSWSITETSEVKSLWAPANGVPVVGVIAAHISTMIENGHPLMYDYVPLPPLEGSYAPRLTTMAGTTCYITADSEHPLEAFKLLLAISTKEGSMAMRFGKEGEDWEWAKEYGKDTVAYRTLNQDAFAGQTDSTWGVGAAFVMKYSLSNEYHQAITNPPDSLTWTELRSQKAFDYAEKYLAVTEAMDPPNSVNWVTVYNEEENNEMGGIMAEVYTYNRNATALFAVGDLDPYNDDDWNEYVKTIKNMGMDTWERLGDQAYQRFMGNN